MTVTRAWFLTVVTLGVTGGGAAAPARVTARSEAQAKPTDPCTNDGPAPGPGSLDPFRPPAPKALELNAAGKIPYRQGKWDDARAQYRAAEAADPEFLAPRLNVACSFVRQDRFAEATAEVLALLDRAYVPWAREILDAADLGALKVRPEMKEINGAMAAAATKWGEGLEASVLFVARQRPALHVPDGPGVFILNPHQEVWAYTPRTQRYRQLTTEDGHVVALARSADGRRALYVTAEKLVRGVKAEDISLRDVAFHELALGTMTTVSSAKLDGDIREVQISAALTIAIKGDRISGTYRVDWNGALSPSRAPGRLGEALVVLTARGGQARGERRLEGSCPFVVRDGRVDDQWPTVAVGPVNGPMKVLKLTVWIGLGGLPLP